ncbi:histidine ammonia-lyase [Propionicicella superfundia]|uniref:histidine ammonia-lyase n=1 Tax=Propionicicella superfundia TaxID=348582 RepID=UPI0003F9D22B|nr:histidine ammonia-lyase [Propionicicella superfundia]
MLTIAITTDDLALEDLEKPFLGPVRVEVDPQALEQVDRGNRVITDAIANGDVVYGVNTGFGKLADRRISPEELLELQRRVIASHMVGVGDPLPPEVVRAAMVIKVRCLSQGHSGVRRTIVETLARMLEADLLPVVPAQGSVGASGDLAPLSHLVGAMTGVGDVQYQGKILPARDAFADAGIEHVELGPKEGVALINGTQVSTALALRGLFLAQRVLNAAVVAGALTMEAAAGRPAALDDRIQQIRRQRGQIRIAESLRALVEGSSVLGVEFPGRRLQDPYSLRCMPQVMGAALDLLTYAADVLAREANAVSDNPLMFPADGLVLSGGNFHGQPVAFSADVVAMALCEIGSLSERRTAVLMDASMSGLAPFLMEGAGLNSGYLMAQVTSAALVAENRSRAFPASVDSIPTSAGQEDHVSMATHGSRRLGEMARNAAYVVAIELLAGAQGLDLRNGGAPAPALRDAYRLVRTRSEFLAQDRALAQDMEALAVDVLAGRFVPVAGIELGR